MVDTGMVLQDGPLSSLPIVMGPAVECAVLTYFGVSDLSSLTPRMVLDLTDGQIASISSTPAARTRIRGLRGIIKLFSPDASTIDRIRAEVTCPITWSLATDPVVSPCCGRVFNRKELMHYHAQDISLTAICPCCRIPSMKSWVMNQPRSSALKNIADAIRGGEAETDGL